MRAEAAGDPGPWRQQAILGVVETGTLMPCAISCTTYVIEHLADDDAVLVIDETGFLKQGKASCGMARQYTGSEGDYDLPDRRLRCLRFASWPCVHRSRVVSSEGRTDDPDRLEATYVPADIGFATKPKLATRMIARAIAASVPFKWVAGDTVYGVGNIEQQLRRRQRLRAWGQQRSCVSILGQAIAGRRYGSDLAGTRHSSDWKRLSAGAGTKGSRLHDWCYSNWPI